MEAPAKLKILFVCLGNICRSPMAEFAMRRLIDEAGLAARVAVTSAGTSDEEEGNPVYPPARRMLEAHGIDCRDKRACQMTRAMLDEADYVVAMDRSNMHDLNRLAGSDGADKRWLLLDFVYGRGSGHEIADPWYTRNFDLAWAEIWEGCTALLQHLQSNERQCLERVSAH